jgi:hypothetical protein
LEVEEEMDEARVREHAEAHARAMADGDLRRASSDLTEEAKKTAPAVMAEMPRPVTGARVSDVVASGADAVATIVYSGHDKEISVESRWADRDGRPMITELTLRD